MKNGILGLLLIMLIMLSACSKERITGSGSVVAEERALNGFTKISLEGASKVFINKGDHFKVVVKAYSNLLPYFETSVKNGTLELGYDDNVNVKNENSEVTITLPVLNGLSIYGSGDIHSTGNFKDNLAFESSVYGSGDIEILEGSSQDFSSTIAGSGSINAFGFIAQKAVLEISGSGNMKITATDKLQARISGSGNIYYKGSPDVSVSISGSGAVLKQ